MNFYLSNRLRKSGNVHYMITQSISICRSMNLKEKLSTMSEEEQLRLLASDGMLVKRPLIIKR